MVTKHQIKREESPAIPYQAPPIIKDERQAFDIKPPPFLTHPYYANPPWLTHHDYNANFFQHMQHRFNGNLNNAMTMSQTMTTIKPELEVQQVNNKITTVIEVSILL